MKIKDFDTDLRDGVLLCNLMEILSGKKIGKYIMNPKTRYLFFDNIFYVTPINISFRFQKFENISICLKFIQSQGLKVDDIGREDIVAGNVKVTLRLLWIIITEYQIVKIEGIPIINANRVILYFNYYKYNR